MPRRRGPSPEQIRRRRAAALVAIALAVAAAVTAIAFALPRVEHRHAQPPPAPPPPKPFRIVFPEGLTRAEMAVRVRDVARIAVRERHKPVALDERQYLAASRAAAVPCFTPRRWTNLEGFLFPATYDFLNTTTSRQLVRAQLQAFCQNWNRIDLAYARSKNLTPYDVLKIASMVEKETLAPEERPLVAAVIYNRLHDHMPLGIDSTLRYGLHIPPTQSILESQLQSDNPYNTRKFAGLPPTPIANPGLASMQAAAHPAHVPYLYFVRKPDKVHHFFTASATAFAQYECAHGYGCGG
ncbi:MAG TPA: endolytic transglycosylase MltG [Gaiellaceae bacterium]|nr:endolytic transglycosylase MltG [Gaiellaceae bacterium]